MGFEKAGCECVWSNEYDKHAALTYITNFGGNDLVVNDIRKILSKDISDFDILCAGFPCQPFSIAGVSKRNSYGKLHGFKDETQGTLFFEIVRILRDKSPSAFFLENVRNLQSHDKGRTFKIIRNAIENCGYSFYYQKINAKLLVPQNRERIFMIGFKDRTLDFEFPVIPDLSPKFRDVLEQNVPEKYTITDNSWRCLQNHAKRHRERGNGFGYGIANLDGSSRALLSRYYKDGSDILIYQGENKNPRKITPRECARLQGYPDTFQIPVSDTQAYKQFGNSVVVPIIEYLAEAVVKTLTEKPRRVTPYSVQTTLI